jgi:hypothetical protein
MNLSKKFMVKGLLFLALIFTFTNCKKDDAAGGQGSVEFEITDAPIDNTNVKGAFVTVTAVKVNGEIISDFSGKQTIDLMAYQNGNTKALGLADLETGSYSNISLVLDYAADANGNAPGCYVLADDNTKHSLQSGSSTTGEITISSGSFEVENNTTTKIVLDFDVRKAIKKQDAPQADDEYDFVTDAELQSSVRLVNKQQAGKVTGSVDDNLSVAGDRIVVYAYKKETYSQQTETQGQGSSNIMFKNAVTSAVVTNDGSYNLSFLSEGDYELYYVGYEDTNNDGQLEAKGMLEVTSITSIDVLGFKVDISADVTINVSVISVTPF